MPDDGSTALAPIETGAGAPAAPERTSAGALQGEGLPQSSPDHVRTAVDSKALGALGDRPARMTADQIAADAEARRAEIDAEKADWTVPEEIRKKGRRAVIDWLAAKMQEKSAELEQPATKRTQRAPVVDKAYKDYGFQSNDEAKQALTIVRDLETPDGARNAVNAIIARSPEVFERIRNHVIADNPQLAFKQSALLLGWDVDAETAPDNALPVELQRLIPPDLATVARTIPAGVLYEWANAHSLIYNLEQEAQLADLWQSQEAAFNESWSKATAEATKMGEDQLTELRDRYADAHKTELAKWKPAGKDEAANAMIRQMAFAGASQAMLADPKFAQLDAAVSEIYRSAPLWHIHGNSFEADQAMIQARQYAAQISTRFGQLLRERVKMLDALIRSAATAAAEEAVKAVDALPLGPVPEDRSLRPGEPPRLTKDRTKVSREWMDWMINKVTRSANNVSVR